MDIWYQIAAVCLTVVSSTTLQIQAIQHVRNAQYHVYPAGRTQQRVHRVGLDSTCTIRSV